MAGGLVAIKLTTPAWILFHTRGTANRKVGLTTARYSPSLVASPQMAVQQPVASARFSSTLPPNTCAQGKNATPLSSVARSTISRNELTLALRLWCVRITPLGLPVVPEV